MDRWYAVTLREIWLHEHLVEAGSKGDAAKKVLDTIACNPNLDPGNGDNMTFVKTDTSFVASAKEVMPWANR